MGFLVKEFHCISGSYIEETIGETETQQEADRIVFRRHCEADRTGERRCWKVKEDRKG